MPDTPILSALERAERALARIETAATRPPHNRRETVLREKVRDVVAELDELIRAAGTR